MNGVSRREFLGLLLASGVAATGAAVASGCSAPTPPTTAPAAPAGAVAAPKPLVKQEITLIQGVEAMSIDPHQEASMMAQNVYAHIAEYLTYVDFRGSSPKVVPQLALSWKNIDPKTWQFKLREGVKYTNGEDFDSEAVRFNVLWVADPANKSYASTYLPPIERIDTPDKYTANIVTKDPYVLMPLTMSRIGMVPPKLYKAGPGPYGRAPVGTGPFKFVEWVKDERIVIEANPNYWGDKPKLQKVTFKSVPESAARVAALKTGLGDLAYAVPYADIAGIKADPNLDVVTLAGLRNMHVHFNTLKGGPFADKRVRQALNYAVDKDAIIKSLLLGYGEKLPGQFLTTSYSGNDPTLQAYPYDPEKAKALLAEAKMDLSQTYEYQTPTGRYVMDKEISEAVGGQLAKVGLKIAVKPVEWSMYSQMGHDKKLGPLMYYGNQKVPDGLAYLEMFLTGASQSYYANKEYDALVNQARREFDEEKRLALYRKGSQMLYDDPPSIFLFTQVDPYAYNKRLAGWKPRPDEFTELMPISVTK